jgi:carotenoid cleavage dioxygenase
MAWVKPAPGIAIYRAKLKGGAGPMPADSTTIDAGDNFAPVGRECEAVDLPVRGTLPPGLAGTLFRNGPNPQFPDPRDHWFTGDGMVHAIRIEDGRVSYRNRWVRTARFQAERDAGRKLFHGFGPGPAGVDSGVANTNIVFHGGRLLALEEAHLPMRLAPDTLETLGTDDRGGALRGPFTAHPKIDPATGEMLFFGYGTDRPLGPGLTFGRLAKDGAVRQFDRFAAPYSAMVHDFVVTARHVLFPILPLTASLTRAMRGGPPFAWEPAMGAYLGVLPRDGSAAAPRWFRAEARYVFHVMNAWDEGRRILADVMEFPEAPLFPHADGSPADPARARARLTRWTLDLDAATDAFAAVPLDDLSGEFPRIDDRRAGLPNRHGWFACASPGREAARGFDAIAHVDHATGRRTLLSLPRGDVPSEPVFVPARADAEEGEGWLLVVVWRAAERISELLVLPATDIAAEAVARVALPQRVPFGFHGNFVATQG